MLIHKLNGENTVDNTSKRSKYDEWWNSILIRNWYRTYVARLTCLFDDINRCLVRIKIYSYSQSASEALPIKIFHFIYFPCWYLSVTGLVHFSQLPIWKVFFYHCITNSTIWYFSFKLNFGPRYFPDVVRSRPRFFYQWNIK